MKSVRIAGFLAVLGLFLFTNTAQALVFNPNIVLTDKQLENSQGWSKKELQQFLLAKGSLGIYATRDIDGKIKSAADIIWRVAQKYQLNPKFIITLMQREQGIVEGRATDEKLDWAVGYAVCDRCEKDHPEMREYKGFANQLELAGERIRTKFLNEIDTLGKTFTGWGPDIQKRTRAGYVTPVNRATAVLYTYTPHIQSNKLLWAVWQRWFGTPLRYPDGSLLQEKKDPGVWLIENGKKRPIISMAALLSRFNPQKIIPVSKGSLDNYEIGRAIAFPDFSILEAPDGTLYLLRGDARHPFASREVFRALGFNPDEINPVSEGELADYTIKEPIEVVSTYPLGVLLQNNQTGGVYYVENGVKSPIWSKELMLTRFSSQKILAVTPEELEEYTTEAPISFLDGELVGEAGTPGIYVISNDARRPIPSAEIFLAMGWQWENVVWTSAKALSLHPTGLPITIIEDSPTVIALQP